MEKRIYTAKDGARYMLAGLLILISCFGNWVESMVIALFQTVARYWVEIGIVIGAIAFACIFPYLLASICYVALA